MTSIPITVLYQMTLKTNNKKTIKKEVDVSPTTQSTELTASTSETFEEQTLISDVINLIQNIDTDKQLSMKKTTSNDDIISSDKMSHVNISTATNLGKNSNIINPNCENFSPFSSQTPTKEDFQTPEETSNLAERDECSIRGLTVLSECFQTPQRTTSEEGLHSLEKTASPTKRNVFLSPVPTVIKEDFITPDRAATLDEPNLFWSPVSSACQEDLHTPEQPHEQDEEPTFIPANSVGSEDSRRQTVDFKQCQEDLDSLFSYAKSFRKTCTNRSDDSMTKPSQKRQLGESNIATEPHHFTPKMKKKKLIIENDSSTCNGSTQWISPLQRDKYEIPKQNSVAHNDNSTIGSWSIWSDTRFSPQSEISPIEIDDNDSDYGWEDSPPPPKQKVEVSAIAINDLGANIREKMKAFEKDLKAEYDLEKIEAKKEDLFRVIENTITVQSKMKLSEIDNLIHQKQDEYFLKLYGTDQFNSWDGDPAFGNADLIETIKSFKQAVPAGATLLDKMTMKHEIDAWRQSLLFDNHKTKFPFQGRIKQIEDEFLGQQMPDDLIESIKAEKKRISDLVIKFLMPYYNEERIQPKNLFPIIARKISHKFYETIADEKDIKKYIDDKFQESYVLIITET
ncbi:hypothetical protein Bhyg_03815 [Pseudolycoriella hygida]|uniref:Set2 Rpb1 interacting domain-containing protein n=1 Tax=Pseudolycoriella hygida TaxID=35572 RepID=A0A9Q0NDZ8_9DIPT|nr:hypothetical protein Bhyg_03815 [Pseudolycoriella hygida]